MVAEHGKGLATGQQRDDQRQHRRAVRATVAKISDKHQTSPLRVMAVLVVAQMLEQILQRGELTMDITNHVKWAGGKGLDKAHNVEAA